jgi:alpha-beta hydrolase superfamily lysophospholipase
MHVGPPPSSLGAKAVSFASESGTTIHGWLVHSAQDRGVVLLLPGVRANRLSMLERARMLREAHYSVLMIDFQATGESTGEAITFGWRERLDVQAAVGFAKRRLPGMPVGIVGTSLGGAATILGAPGLDVQGAVLEAVYPSIEKAVENRLRIRLGTAGAGLAPLLVWQLQPRLGVRPADLRPVDRVAELHCPILIIAGTDDLHTTLDDTRALYAAAREPKELWLISGAGHEDYLRVAGDAYRMRVVQFLDRALQSDRQASVELDQPASVPTPP